MCKCFDITENFSFVVGKQKQQEMNKNKEIIVLNHKRSNAINIGMTKLPPPRSIKTAILKMDATIMNREGIEVRIQHILFIFLYSIVESNLRKCLKLKNISYIFACNRLKRKMQAYIMRFYSFYIIRFFNKIKMIEN